MDSLFGNDGVRVSTVATVGVAVAASCWLLSTALNRVVSPRIDAREPPVLWPTVPLIGHIVSFAREQLDLFPRLYRAHRLPIYTMPMWTGKMYVINSPELILAAMRNRHLSFDPFNLEFAKTTMGLEQRHVDAVSSPDFIAQTSVVTHAALSGEPLRRSVASGLESVADEMNRVDGVLDVPDVYEWLRRVISAAVMRALFGDRNPIGPADLENINTFDKNLPLLAFGIAKWVNPKAVTARDSIQAALRPFFASRAYEDPTVSALIRDRAEHIRAHAGWPDEDLALSELSMAWVALVNTIPTLFWVFVHVLASPARTARVRAECEALVTLTPADGKDGKDGKRTATFDAWRIDKDAPFLMACYHETNRICNAFLSLRRVMADTTLSDGHGREYLLTKGSNVEWPNGVAHTEEDFWGADAEVFRPERWLDEGVTQEEAALEDSGAKPASVSSSSSSANVSVKLSGSAAAADGKKRRTFPFGGGKHLCPGRHFAMYEITALVGALAVGFDVKGAHEPARKRGPDMGTAMRKPVWKGVDPGVKIARREGWEDVEWRFVC